MGLIIHNGELKEQLDLEVSANRAFRYGDGFFESMAIRKAKAPLFPWHRKRMLRANKALKFKLADSFPEKILADCLVQLDKTKNYRLRIQLFREGEGGYAPVGNHISWIAEWREIEAVPFEEPGPNLTIGFSNYPAPLSIEGIKSVNAQTYVLAAIEARDNEVDDVLLMDTEGSIIESSRSNLFLIKDDTLMTPDLKHFGVRGCFRQLLLDRLDALGFDLKLCQLNKSALMEADECFLTNAVRGIQPISKINDEFYPNQKTRFLHNQLLEEILD